MTYELFSPVDINFTVIREGLQFVLNDLIKLVVGRHFDSGFKVSDHPDPPADPKMAAIYLDFRQVRLRVGVILGIPLSLWS